MASSSFLAILWHAENTKYKGSNMGILEPFSDRKIKRKALPPRIFQKPGRETCFIFLLGLTYKN